MSKILVLSVLVTLTLWLCGCTAEMTMHYPGKWNAVDRHESGSTFYRGYTPPFPMDPPTADSQAWRN